MTKKPAAKKLTRSARRPGTHTAKTPAAKVAKPAKSPAPAAEQKAPAAKPAPETKAAPAPTLTRAGLAYEMIKKGATNAEVLAALQEKFNLPPEHSYYPGWYRSRLVMDGVITKAFATEHRGPAIARKPATAK